MKRILRKIKQVFLIIVACTFKSKSAFLRIIKYEAENSLKDCCDMGTKQIEEMQDLLFHIEAYLEVPDAVREIILRDTGGSYIKARTRFAEYLEEVERQRAVERLYIMESLKHFPFDPVF